jgi:hypothetical protein
MGYLSLLGECGECGACGRLFLSNPHSVPSLRLADGRQLIFCRECVQAANPERQRRGLPPILVHPLAYEAAEET